MRTVCLILGLLLTTTLHAADAPWIAKSNQIAEEYTRFWSELYPELGSSFGMTEFDAKATGIVDDMEAKERAGLDLWKAKLTDAVQKEADPNLKIDLDILKDNVERSLEGIAIDDKVGSVPYALASRTIYSNLFMLVNPQSPKERKAAAVDRFKAYVEGFGSFKPYTVAYESRTRAKLAERQGKPTLYPLRTELEKYLADSPTYVQGVRKMLEETGRKDWEPLFRIYEKQISTYDAFLKKELLPKTRTDYKLPPEVYAFILKSKGIDQTPSWLIETGRKDYEKVYAEFKRLAAEIASKPVQRKDFDPPSVIKSMKRKQLTKAKEVEALYQKADKELAAIIEKNGLVTLPKAPLKIRLAGDAESKAGPVPHLTPPPLIGNKGERPEFVVPTSSSGKLPFDDFSYEEAAIVLTAHEGRPGHDLQFSSMLDGGVSLIRARYAFNNVNVEGWGLYAEDLVYPYLSHESQLVALQTRLWRIARTFLDPEIQTGKIQPKGVEDLFVNQLGVSKQMAKLEVERYTFEDPGQAPSYYYGLLKLRALRDKLGTTKGAALRCFNDAVLSVGLLPIDKAEALIAAAGCQKATH